ncbi:MAG: acyl-CoA dehydrogenase family protein [Rhodococcus sp. (in: high G+C Gram-positive bacteria)]|uniref:acyl-CoA dehydrogenase family protein n=1 Tax=Rhodococcus sp. TaxID=1831 RepID=UPI003BAE5514
MLLELTPDQEFFRDTTARFLQDRAPVAELRRLRDDAVGFEADYWRRGAELGWTSLLVGEGSGGGSISDVGLTDLTLVAHEFGRRAAPGPLIPTNIVAAMLDTQMLDHSETDAHGEVLAALLAGTSTAAWCFAEPRPNTRTGVPPLEIRVEGSEVVVNGTKRPVEAALTADVLLVTGHTGDNVTQVLVPSSASGVRVRPLQSVDLTRRFAVVEFDDVRLPVTALVGRAGEAAGDVERARQLALVISCAESVGAMQAAFDMTLEWAFDRYSFGRPLASYQELKHRFADMKTWLEASHAITDLAAAAVAAGSTEAAELTSAAKAYVGEYGAELLQDCVQIHGGIGLTFEHDIHLFLRRTVANRSNYGTPAEHRQLIADIVDHQEDTQ